VGFNSRYLLDALGVIQTERVKLECKNPMSPSVIRAADDEEYLAVIMPLRIEW
jgi:DNA polymerase-3 subunit beta